MTVYCLINHRKRFVACVDPKCGSNTVKDWFNHTFPVPKERVRADYHTDMIPAETVAQLDGYLKIFFIRHPLRRLVSFYYSWVVIDEANWCFADAAKRVGLKDKTFSEFIHALRRLSESGLELQHHLQPQTRVLGGAGIDEIVKLEELDERMQTINRRLGVSYVPKHRHQREYAPCGQPGAFDLAPGALRDRQALPFDCFYDDELESIARDIYRDDLSLHDSN